MGLLKKNSVLFAQGGGALAPCPPLATPLLTTVLLTFGRIHTFLRKQKCGGHRHVSVSGAQAAQGQSKGPKKAAVLVIAYRRFI